MNHFKLILKLFIRNKLYVFVFITLIIFEIYINYFWLSEYIATDDILGSINGTLIFTAVSFIFAYFLCFELSLTFTEIGVEETIKSSKHMYMLTAAAAGIMAVSITYLIALIYGFYVYHISVLQADGLAFHIFSINTLYFFLIPSTGAILGTVSGTIFKRLKGYISLLIFLFLGTSLSDILVIALFEGIGLDIYPIISIFKIIPQKLDYMNDFIYGIPVELYKWFVCIFWIALSIELYLLYERIRFKSFKKMTLLFVPILLFTSYSSWDQGSILSFERNPKGMIYEVKTYFHQKEVLDEDGQFDITAYNMSAKIDKQLDMEAMLEIDSAAPLEKYKFTLYSGYKIKSVKDEQGRNLKFSRHDDYFDVFPREGKKISSITIRYKGSSPKFYSSRQGVLLLGYFPYYPMEGYRPVFLFTEEGRSFNTSIDVVPKEFDININSRIPIYSNMDSETKGNPYHFSGIASTLTLIGGFIEEKTVGSTHIYSFALYPHIELDLEEVSSELGYFNKVFYLPNTVIFTGDFKESSVLLDDYFLSVAPNNAEFIINNIAGNRSGVQND